MTLPCGNAHSNKFFPRCWCHTKQMYHGYERFLVWTLVLLVLTAFWYGIFALFGVTF